MDENGSVQLVNGYQPYWETLSSAGSAQSNYGFDVEWYETGAELIYLRARYYLPYFKNQQLLG